MSLTRWWILSLALPLVGQAKVQPAPLFRDGAVLQRDMPIPVWGAADPGEQVRVTWRGVTQTVVADAHGQWRVTWPAEPANRESAEMVVAGTNTVRVRDILVGELWLCSGQSNMAWTVAAAANAKAEIAAGDYPLLRHFAVPKTAAMEPAATVGGTWEAASPKTVGDFSAVAYYFGRDLQQRLAVPVGLVNASWGSTPIESWMSVENLSADAAFAGVAKRWVQVLAERPAKLEDYQRELAEWVKAGRPSKGRPRSPDGPGSRMQPSGLYNGMLHPFVPMALRGVIWYQGESNSSRPDEYARLFASMIEAWRADFGRPDLPFYFVQLASTIRRYDPSGEEFSRIREAQRRALALPGTGMAVTVDIGDARSVHPLNKQDVGARLARLALAGVYDFDVEACGPVVVSARRVAGAVNAWVRVDFSHAAGLMSDDPDLAGFALADESGYFFDAKARIVGTTVELYAERVRNPVSVRYAWGNNPAAPLRSGSGLPASPFWETVLPREAGR